MVSERAAPAENEISDSLIETVCRRLSQNKRVRRTLPERGRLHIDRQLPFLCVYRRPADADDPGTCRLVMGEAAYLLAPGAARHRQALSKLVRRVVETMVAEFGALLLVEIWAGADGGWARDPAAKLKLDVLRPPGAPLAKTVDVLARRLRQIKVLKRTVDVDVIDDNDCAPPGMPPLLGTDDADVLHCWKVGLVVPPVYRDAKTGIEYPVLMRRFRRSLGRALRQTFYQFAHSLTTHRPPHYHELGRRAVVKAVWEVDRQLSEVSNSFDFLLQLTPVNADDAWHEFKQSGFQRIPEFHYRPSPFDPALLKRQLYQIPIERVEDPALQHVFQEKQRELDRKITMLAERDTRRFLHGSQQLYGGVEDDLFQIATELLDRSWQVARGDGTEEELDAEAFGERARTEFEHYRSRYPEFSAKAEVTGKVAGIMVSRGTLLINRYTKVAASRVDALLQHEVGTHLLTYYNGRAHPFRQLYSGLAGYEALQEGLAVLAEYLVGGLSCSRMRQLAGRVIAVRRLLDGASFVDTFRSLNGTFELPRRSAFRTTMRVHRGGGLTKDAVYLRGLRQVLAYLRKGGEIEPLLVGKIAVDQVPIIKELRYRKVLCEPPLRPRYMDNHTATERLAMLREQDIHLVDLVDGECVS